MGTIISLAALFGVSFLFASARSRLRKRADEDRRRRGAQPWGET